MAAMVCLAHFIIVELILTVPDLQMKKYWNARSTHAMPANTAAPAAGKLKADYCLYCQQLAQKQKNSGGDVEMWEAELAHYLGTIEDVEEDVDIIAWWAVCVVLWFQSNTSILTMKQENVGL